MQLVRGATALDTDAFLELIDNNTDRMYKTAWAILGNEADAADAIQETILDCYEKLNTLRHPEYFTTWLTRILINNCLSIRRQYRTDSLPEQMPEIPVEDQYEEGGFEELISDVDEKYRLILTLYYADELSVAEIADLLEMKENTVKTRLARGREQVRRYLDEQNKLTGVR